MSETTPTGEPVPEERTDDADHDERGLREDPVTGSTPRDPAAEESGPPPAGEDPMAGESPSA